jgi:hypothetical protein
MIGLLSGNAVFDAQEAIIANAEALTYDVGHTMSERE